MKKLAALLAALVLVPITACKDDRAEARESLARAKQLSAWHRDREAETALRDAARLDPTLYEARMRLARIALDARRFDEAKTQAASVVRDAPRSAYALELLGRAELGLGHDAAALDALTKSRGGDATRVRLGFELGRIDERLGKRDDAIAAYRTVVAADAHALDARLALARALMPGPPREEVRTLLAEAEPLAAPSSPQKAQLDGLRQWCDRLDAPPPVSPTARQAALERAVNFGILALLSSDGAHGAFGADHALGNDANAGLGGGIIGDPIGDNFGFGGLGLSGTGRGGGGGTGEGTIGLGTIGTGGGTGGGTGYSYGSGRFGTGVGSLGGASTGPRVRLGAATARGTLSVELVRRVVQRHLNELRFCYEQELAQSPSLREGTLTMHIVVGADGSVTSSSVPTSSLGSARVETCVSNAARRWTFPAPDGGGVVIIEYPITFEHAATP